MGKSVSSGSSASGSNASGSKTSGTSGRKKRRKCPHGKGCRCWRVKGAGQMQGTDMTSSEKSLPQLP